MKINHTVYMHLDNDGAEVDNMLRKGIPLTEQAQEELYYMLYEIGIELEIDTETGEYRILGVKE